MYLEQLSKKQVKAIYRSVFKEDFPPDERKPLRAMMKAMDSGIYECYGLMQDGDVLGYAFFVRNGNDFLLDYFATAREKRNNGNGSVFLGLLREKFSDAGCVMAEVEDPAYAENDEDRSLQTRRLNFYLRNSFIDTGVKMSAFGVKFIIIEMDLGKTYPEDELRAMYKAHYRAILPEHLYRRAIKE